MISNSEFTTSVLNSEYSRRFPDPMTLDANGDQLNIEHHILLVRAKDIPTGIPKSPNPRVQRIDRGIYKEVRESLEDSGDLSFHLKNKGITILAHRVDQSQDKKSAKVYFGEYDGIADGGHTYEIILKSKEEDMCPDGQFVKVEVITGIPKHMADDITGGLNTAVQVDDASLMNLDGKFEWVKVALKGEPYSGLISYKQNEQGKFDIREILALMTLFNVNKFTSSQHPKEAYVSKSKCLDLYGSDPKSFEMLKPILKDILYLHDYVHIRSRKMRNAAEKARTGGMTGVFASRKKGNYEFIFIGNQVAEKLGGGPVSHKLWDGAFFPMLGALRFLVEQKPGDDFYSWKLQSFDQVKMFFDEIAAELVNATYKTSLTYGRKPNPIGKDENHWDLLYSKVGMHFMTRNSN